MKGRPCGNYTLFCSLLLCFGFTPILNTYANAPLRENECNVKDIKQPETVAEFGAYMRKIKTCLKADDKAVMPQSLMEKISGHYINSFESGDVEGNIFNVTDYLYVTPHKDKQTINIEFLTNFFNGHVCSGAGPFRYIGNGQFLYEHSDKEDFGAFLLKKFDDIRAESPGCQSAYPADNCKEESGALVIYKLASLYYNNFETADENEFYYMCGARGGLNGTTFFFSQKENK